MKTNNILLAFTIVIFCCFVVTSSTNIKLIRSNLLNDVNSLWNHLSSPEWKVLAKSGSSNKPFLESINRLLLNLDRNITDSVWIPNNDNMEWSLMALQRHESVINGLWEKFINTAKVNNENEMKELAWAVLRDSPTDPPVLSLPNIFNSITDILEESNPVQDWQPNRCDIQQSRQQLIYNIYRWLELMQLKTYTMSQMSWLLLQAFANENTTVESDMLRRKYLNAIFEQALLTKKEMIKASSQFERCSPKHQIEGDTYIKLSKFLQGYIVNEIDLNERSSCSENCGFYKYTKQYGCFKNNYCSRQPMCRGNIIDCRFVDSDMWVCPSVYGKDRRYEWIEYENGRVLGESNKAKSCTRAVTKVDSWWRWLFWHCSYCFCLCDDSNHPSTVRSFSLKWSTSDIQENYVVTGVRLVKLNKYIYLQIQQGKLMPGGIINFDSIDWKPINLITSSDTEGVDYHKMVWEHRAIDLDDIKVEGFDYVVTGVRFRRLGSHLNLEIQANHVDIKTGKLSESGQKIKWLGNDNTDAATQLPRGQFSLKSSHIPIRSDGTQLSPSEYVQEDSKPDTYLLFRVSSMDSDASQNTVPYMESLNIVTDPPSPLSGVGIYHKGYSSADAGLIALKIFTIDYSKLITDDPPVVNEAT